MHPRREALGSPSGSKLTPPPFGAVTPPSWKGAKTGFRLTRATEASGSSLTAYTLPEGFQGRIQDDIMKQKFAKFEMFAGAKHPQTSQIWVFSKESRGCG